MEVISLHGTSDVRKSCEMCERCLLQKLTTSCYRAAEHIQYTRTSNVRSRLKWLLSRSAWSMARISPHASAVRPAICTAASNAQAEGGRRTVISTDPSSCSGGLRFRTKRTNYECIYSKFWNVKGVNISPLDITGWISLSEWAKYEKLENNLELGPSDCEAGTISN
jgi:hypothetical protein